MKTANGASKSHGAILGLLWHPEPARERDADGSSVRRGDVNNAIDSRSRVHLRVCASVVHVGISRGAHGEIVDGSIKKPRFQLGNRGLFRSMIPIVRDPHAR